MQRSVTIAEAGGGSAMRKRGKNVTKRFFLSGGVSGWNPNAY
jgi:hypothetical protein